MKEWQRWVAMADDFGKVGDHHREAECLHMAVEILPPGHKEVKLRLCERLEDARTRAIEAGPSPPTSMEGFDEEVLEARETLSPEEAREGLLEYLRHRCTSIDGVDEATTLSDVAAETGLEGELLAEALEDLVDEGLVFRPRSGRLLVDGVLDEPDVEMAVLALLGELSTAGRGGSRRTIVETLMDRGFTRDELEEAIDELEESGRLEESHKGQLRVALDIADIQEVHHQVMAAIEELDSEGDGVLTGHLERELTTRGWDLDEVKEAIEELVDEGDLLREGRQVRATRPAMNDALARELLLEVLHALSEDRDMPVPLLRVIRASSSRGMGTALTHRMLDDLVDSGRVWRDDRGVHLSSGTPPTGPKAREMLLEVVRQLGHGGIGASRLEVLDAAREQGLAEDAARELLEDLIDEGRVHDAGSGFLRPG